MPAAHVTRTIEAVWRIESARLIAGLARLVRDVGLAEDLAQEALVAALEQWPEAGVPDNPGAWLMATAKHRAIDRLRRADVHRRKTEELGRDMELRGEADVPDLAAEAADPFDDDLLRLIFTTCHPVLSTDARVALTLRLLGELAALGYLERHPRRRERALGAHDPLRHGRLGDEVGARDLGGREPAEQPQRERHPCVRGQHRVARREDQSQEIVVERVIDRGLEIGPLELAAQLDLVPELLGLALLYGGAAQAVDRAVLARGHQPGARVVRDA